MPESAGLAPPLPAPAPSEARRGERRGSPGRTPPAPAAEKTEGRRPGPCGRAPGLRGEPGRRGRFQASPCAQVEARARSEV